MFIGVNMDREAITRLLDGCLLTDSEMAEHRSSGRASSTCRCRLLPPGCLWAASRLPSGLRPGCRAYPLGKSEGSRLMCW